MDIGQFFYLIVQYFQGYCESLRDDHDRIQKDGTMDFESMWYNRAYTDVRSFTQFRYDYNHYQNHADLSEINELVNRLFDDNQFTVVSLIRVAMDIVQQKGFKQKETLKKLREDQTNDVRDEIDRLQDQFEKTSQLYHDIVSLHKRIIGKWRPFRSNNRGNNRGNNRRDYQYDNRKPFNQYQNTDRRSNGIQSESNRDSRRSFRTQNESNQDSRRPFRTQNESNQDSRRPFRAKNESNQDSSRPFRVQNESNQDSRRQNVPQKNQSEPTQDSLRPQTKQNVPQ